jgi:putative transposase
VAFVKYDPEKHHRRSLRIRGYDYSQGGVYFVTICTRDREYLFGEVVDGEMQLNNVGQMARGVWEELPERFSSVRLDAFIVMPNHVHGIIVVGAQFIAPQVVPWDRFRKGAINRAPKAVSTREIRRIVNPGFAWQRNYYEHVVREEESLNRIRQYVADNPARWAFDSENPWATNPETVEPWRA